MKLIAALACGLALAGTAAAQTFLILPFSNLSKSTNLDWLGESMAEAVREALAGEGLLALGREDREEAFRRLSIKPYRPMTKASALRVAETLDADEVIFGSFEVLPAEADSPKGRGTVRIHAQIVDLKKTKRGPEYTELGALEDLAQLQTHLAWQTLQAVLPNNAPSEEEFKQRAPAIRIDAIEHYIRGLLASALEQKLSLFQQAVKLDPRHSNAWFELGKLQWSRKEYRAAAASLSHVGATQAHYREAQFYLGLSKYMVADYVGAQQAFEYVAAVVPLNEVWNNLGVAQMRRNLPDALPNLRKALEGDSADPDYHFNVGLVLYRQGKIDEAAASFQAVIDRNPEDREAGELLERARSGKALVQRALAIGEGGPRLKTTYEESAYLQLKAVLEGKR